MTAPGREGMSWLALAGPPAAIALVAAGAAGIVDPGAAAMAPLTAALLVIAVFAAVSHAEVIAERLGQPFGSIVLGLAVTVIEVSLIISVMLAHEAVEQGAPSSQVARDTVFAGVMLVLNGVVGVCLLAGGLRFHEQGFQSQGAATLLAVIGTLATLTLILPDYTLSEPGPYYAPAQLVFVAVTSLALYCLLIFVQTVRHRTLFLDDDFEEAAAGDRPTTRRAAASGTLLVVALVGVVLLADSLAPALERGIRAVGLPGAVVGIVIAALVLMPEGISALRAARANRLQTSLNIALGSALASIGLTIPVIAGLSLWLGRPLDLGLEPEHVVLLALTLFVSGVTLATGRTTVLQGGVHLVIFGAFITISVVP